MSRTTVITSTPAARFSGPPPDRVAGRPSRMAHAQGNYAPGGTGPKAAAELRANAFLEREAVLDNAMHQGIINGSLRAHFATLWDADPEGTRAHLESLGLAKSGHQQQAVTASADAYDDSALSGAERRRIAAARDGRTSQVISGGL